MGDSMPSARLLLRSISWGPFVAMHKILYRLGGGCKSNLFFLFSS